MCVSGENEDLEKIETDLKEIFKEFPDVKVLGTWMFYHPFKKWRGSKFTGYVYLQDKTQAEALVNHQPRLGFGFRPLERNGTAFPDFSFPSTLVNIYMYIPVYIYIYTGICI